MVKYETKPLTVLLLLFCCLKRQLEFVPELFVVSTKLLGRKLDKRSQEFESKEKKNIQRTLKEDLTK